jgi:hypothetical protein
MKQMRRYLWIVPVLLPLLLPIRGMGQSKHVPTEKLTGQAEIVAFGTVKETRSEWNEARTSIRTRVTLVVDEYLKGSGGGTLDIYVPGGEVDGVGEIYTHMAKFKKGEEVVVFAEKDKKSRYRVTGGDQGKVLVKSDKLTGRPMVGGTQPLEGYKAEVRGHAQGAKK